MTAQVAEGLVYQGAEVAIFPYSEESNWESIMKQASQIDPLRIGSVRVTPSAGRSA